MAGPEEMYQCQTVNCGYITRTRVTGKEKFLRTPNLRTCRKTGNARGAAHQKRNLKRCELNDRIEV